MNAFPPPPRLIDLPLWRLLVLLDDAERLLGPRSDSARAIAGAVRRKLGRTVTAPADGNREVVPCGP